MSSNQNEMNIQSLVDIKLNHSNDTLTSFETSFKPKEDFSSLYSQRNTRLKEIYVNHISSQDSNPLGTNESKVHTNAEHPDKNAGQKDSHNEKNLSKPKNDGSWSQKFNKMVMISRMVDLFKKFGMSYNSEIIEDPNFLHKLDSLFNSFHIHFPNRTFKPFEYTMFKYDLNHVQKKVIHAAEIPTKSEESNNDGIQKPRFINLTQEYKDYIYSTIISSEFDRLYILGQNVRSLILDPTKLSPQLATYLQKMNTIISEIKISQASIYGSTLALGDLFKELGAQNGEELEMAKLVFCEGILLKAVADDISKDGNLNRNLYWLLGLVYMIAFQNTNIINYLNLLIMMEVPFLAGFKTPSKCPQNMRMRDYNRLLGFCYKEDGSLEPVDVYMHRTKVLCRLCYMLNHYKKEGVLSFVGENIVEPKADEKTALRLVQRCGLILTSWNTGVLHVYEEVLREMIAVTDVNICWDEVLSAIYHCSGIYSDTTRHFEPFAKVLRNKIYPSLNQFCEENPVYKPYRQQNKKYEEKWDKLTIETIEKPYLYYLEF